MVSRFPVILLTTALALPAGAAPPVVRNPTPFLVEGNPLQFLKGNFGGDAADDLVLIESGSTIQTLINVPSGPFGAPVTTPITDSVQSAASGHFDADGFLDLAIVVPWDHVAIYHGNGDGTFRQGGSFQTTTSPQGVAVGDFNGDGKADVAIAHYYSVHGPTVHFGNGSGNLGSAITNPNLASAKYATATDVNGDGKADLILSDDSNVTLLIGLGDGHFRAAWSNSSSFAGGGVAFGDFNEDTKIDLFVATDRYGTFKLYRGVGDGTFLTPTTHHLIGSTGPERVKALDIDGDGHLDVVAGAYVGPISVLRGNGDGTFRQPEHWFTDAIHSFQTGDFDRNGTIDVMLRSGYQGGPLFFIGGTGGGALDAYRSHHASPDVAEERQAAATAAADMNGDGKPDLVVITEDGYPSTQELAVLLNTGGGNFAAPTFIALPEVRYPRKPAIGDVNGDGKIDVVVANGVYLNHGDATFASPFTLPLDGSGETFLADLNSDFNLDLVASSNQISSIYLGSGTGYFSFASTVDMDVGGIADFNGDGRPDLAGRESHYSSGVVVGINNGSGGFPLTEVDSTYYRDFGTVADFNNDGHADIMVGAYGGTRIIFGQGDGTFGHAVDFRMNSEFEWGAAAADLNDDGAVDLITGSNIHLGDGTGRFPSYAHVLSGWTTQNAIADFDSDGDLDLVITNSANATVALVQPNIGPDPPVVPTMTLVADPAAPRHGQGVKYTATLSPPSVQRHGGAIVFFEDGVPIELQILYDTQEATFNTAWSTGAHSLTVRYTGDSHHAAVAQTLQHDVSRGATQIYMSPSSRACAAEIFVFGGLGADGSYGLPGPSGDLVFREGTTVLPSRKVTNGYNLSGLGAGTHTITVDYPGDSNYEPSSATFQLVVNPSVFVSISSSSGVFANESGNVAFLTGSGLAGSTISWSITNGTIDSGLGTTRVRYTSGASGEVTLSVTVTKPGSLCQATATSVIPILERSPGATLLYIVTPCRVLDTRQSVALASNEIRDVPVGGACTVPLDAKSVVANVTVLAPATDGWMSLFAAGTPWPGTSTVSYRAARTRANNTVIPLSPDGRLTVMNAGANLHFIIDVYGYFK